MSLSGKTVVFTGTLSMSRAEASSAAKAAGAKVAGSVSSLTDVVVAGPDAVTTAKVLAAKASGKKIFSEAQFKKALGAKTTAMAKAKAFAKAKAKAKPKAKAAAKAKAKVKPTIVKSKAGSKLAGLTICMTGAVSETRKKMTDLIKRHGGGVTSSLTGNTTHLLCVNSGNSSSKYSKAIDKGVKIIRERQLRQLIGELKPDRGNVCLAAGHKMKFGINPEYDNYVCNLCAKNTTGARWYCGKCQDDICPKCRKKS